MSQDLFVESQFCQTAPLLSEPWLKPFRCQQPCSTLSCSFNKNGSQCSPPSIRQLEHLPATISIGSRSKKSYPTHELRTSDGVEFVFGRFCQIILAYRDEESTSKQNDIFADIHCLFCILEYMGRMELPDDVATTYKHELVRMFRKCFSLPNDVHRIEDNQKAHITIFQSKLAVSCKWLADSRNDVVLCVTYGLIHILNRTKTMISCACVQELLVCIFTEHLDFFVERLPTLVDECARNKEVKLSNGIVLGVLSPLDILRFFVEAVQHLASKVSDTSIPIEWSTLIFLLSDKLIGTHFADVCTILMNFLRSTKCANLEKCRSQLTSLLLSVIRLLEKNPVYEVERMIGSPMLWANEIRDQFEFTSFQNQDSFALLYFLMKQDDLWNSVRDIVLRQFSAAKLNSFTKNYGTMFSILFLLSDNQWFADQFRTLIDGAIDTTANIKSLIPAVEAFAHLMEENNSVLSRAVISRALNRLPLPSDGKKIVEIAATFKCFGTLDMNKICKLLSDEDMLTLLDSLTNSRTSLDSPVLWNRAIKMLSERIQINRIVSFVGLKLQIDCGKRNTKDFSAFLSSVFDSSKESLRTADIVLPILTKVLENPVTLSSSITSKCIGLWIYSVCAFSLSHEDSVNTLCTCIWGLLNPTLRTTSPTVPLEMTSFPKAELNIIHFFEVLESSQNKPNLKKILKDWVTIEWANIMKPLISGAENASKTKLGQNYSQNLAIELSCKMIIKLGPVLFEITTEFSSSPIFSKTIFILLHFLTFNRPVCSLLAELVLTLANLPKTDAFILGRIKSYLQDFPVKDLPYLKGLNETKYFAKIKEDTKLLELLKLL